MQSLSLAQQLLALVGFLRARSTRRLIQFGGGGSLRQGRGVLQADHGWREGFNGNA